MFDFFVTETLWIYEMIVEYEWLFAIFYFTTSLTSYVIFVYHESQFNDLTFFLRYVTKLYDFSNTRYNLYKTVFTAFLPLAMYIIVWSMVERFNSKKFLMRFG
jgi:hypothetical protein